MAELGKYFERDDLGSGRFRHTQNLRPIAFLENGTFQRIRQQFEDGDANFSHIVTAAGFFSYITPQGDWRIHPTRDPQVWFSIGAPFVNPANPTRASMNPLTRSGNVLTSVNPNFDARIINAGHYLKLEFQLKNGFVPPQGKIAFPVDARGITRVGDRLVVGGETVMYLPPPVVYDAANPLAASRPISVAFQAVSGTQYIIYTLPDLTGMGAPVIDPTLTLQPDGTAGMDSYMASALPNNNNGTSANLACGQVPGDGTIYRFVVKFDFSTLPDGATISSSTFSITPNTDQSANARTYRVFRLKRAWVESQVTWNVYTTGNSWSTAGGFGANDCEQTDIGSRAWSASETLNVLKDFTMTPTTKVGLDLGNGWLVKADTESADGYYINSSDHATASLRPKFVATYTTGGLLYPQLFDGLGGFFRGLQA